MRCSFPQRRVNKDDGSVVYHACGNCKACRKRKQQEWSFRSYVESTYYSDSVFLTLTYCDSFLPSNGSLVKDEIARFMKRLRKLTGKKLRYFGSGEYGEQKHRPHYHVIVFGLSLDDPVFYAKYYSQKSKGYWCYCKAWQSKLSTGDKFPTGEVFIGSVTPGTCNYCAKYLCKRLTGKLAKEFYEKYGIVPEFSAMSRRPGLGLQYLLDNYDLIKKRGYVMLKGHKIPLSVYYINKLFEESTDEREEFKMERQKSYAQSYDDFFAKRNIGEYSKAEYMKMWLEQQEINLTKQLEVYK